MEPEAIAKDSSLVRVGPDGVDDNEKTAVVEEAIIKVEKAKKPTAVQKSQDLIPVCSDESVSYNYDFVKV